MALRRLRNQVSALAIVLSLGALGQVLHGSVTCWVTQGRCQWNQEPGDQCAGFYYFCEDFCAYYWPAGRGLDFFVCDYYPPNPNPPPPLDYSSGFCECDTST